MAIPVPPTAPNRTDPANFSSRMDAFLAWLVAAEPEFNALAVVTNSSLWADGSAAAPGMRWTSDTNTGFFRPGNDMIGFAGGGVEYARFDASGNLYVGSPSVISGIGAGRISTQGVTGTAGNWSFVKHGGNLNGPSLAMGKTRGAAIDTYTLINSGDQLGNIEFWGADGTTMYLGARLQAYSIGTPAAGDVRGGFRLQTGSGAAGAVTTRLTVDDTTIAATLPITTTGYIAGGFNALSAGTLALAFGTKNNCSVTPNAAGAFTTTVPPSGTVCTLTINTSGTTSFSMTFGSGFKSTGALATGTVTAKTFTVVFISDGTTVNEISRSVAM